MKVLLSVSVNSLLLANKVVHIVKCAAHLDLRYINWMSKQYNPEFIH